MKVLYLYSGERKKKFSGRINIDYPDTQFYGLNHLVEFGIDAEYKEVNNKILGFRTKHLFSYFLTCGYDIVFGPSILFMMFFKKIFRPERKFILLNIGIARTISSDKKGFKAKIVKWFLEETDAIVCLSQAQAAYLENKFAGLKGKLFFVPLGVDAAYYKPEFENRGSYILSVGRDNGRDYKTVIDTAKLMPEEEFHIVCSRRNIEEIKEFPDNVKIFYDIPIYELNRKYHEAKLLLLLTHEDNFSDGSDCSGQTVLLDAMASGLPVVASRKKYLKDYVQEGVDILSVDFYNSADVREKIKLLREDTLRRKIAVNARKKIEDFFSTREMARGLAAVFEKAHE
ncbi:MAG: glycosyltransferase [Candidatus Pacebacteria bacterium]|nr:glycosyltransferase [Candidatus Paceibacterota bacterium]